MVTKLNVFGQQVAYEEKRDNHDFQNIWNDFENLFSNIFPENYNCYEIDSNSNEFDKQYEGIAFYF